MIIIIPAYQPDEKLTGVVDGLISRTHYPIVIVDDGSRPDCQPLFAALAEKEYVTVLHHEVNRGKGAAMKTAFQYVYDNCPDADGVITVDADGQHLPEDVLRVSGKTGAGVRELLDRIVARVPAPAGEGKGGVV